MNGDEITERLAAHADELNARGANPSAQTDAPSAQGTELESLMSVAARVHRTLQPTPVAPAFRARLRDSLVIAAQRQSRERIAVSPNAPSQLPRGQWGWLIGAAALGSAAGLIAVVLRSRTPTPAQSTAAAAVNRQN